MLELHRNVFYNIITSGKRWVKTIHAYARTHVRAHTHTPMQTQVIQRSLISYKEDFFFSSLCRHLYASCACPQSECRLGRLWKRRRPRRFSRGGGGARLLREDALPDVVHISSIHRAANYSASAVAAATENSGRGQRGRRGCGKRKLRAPSRVEKDVRLG